MIAAGFVGLCKADKDVLHRLGDGSCCLPGLWQQTSSSPRPQGRDHTQSKAFPRRKQAHPSAASHRDPTARGNGQSMEKATAGIEPTWTLQYGWEQEPNTEFIFFCRDSRISLILLLIKQVCRIPEFGGWYLGYRELWCSPSAWSGMGSKDHTEKWWREENEGATG